jgi:hypothetical protein
VAISVGGINREEESLPDRSFLAKDVLWRTLTTNSTFDEHPAGAEYRAFFEAYLLAVLGNSTDDSAQSSNDARMTRENEMAREYRDTARRRMRYRRLCSTEKDYFGAVPQESRPGDLICLFEGARSLFAVRD